MFRRRSLTVILVAGLIATAAACSSSAEAVRPRIRLASIASATGSGAAYGVTAQHGVQLAVEKLGEGRIDLRTFDDLSTNDGAMTAMNTAVEWGADVVFAPTLSPVALSVMPVANQNRIPTLGVTNATLDMAASGEYMWRVSKSEADMVTASVDAVARRGQRAVLIWEPADGYSVGSRDAFLAAATARGVDVVAELSYVDGSTTPASLAAQAESSSPDLLLMALRSAVAADFLKATSTSKAIRVGGNGFNSVAVIDRAGSASNGLIVSGSWNVDAPIPMSQQFIDEYLAKYGTAPDSFAAQGYAAVEVLLAAARAGGGTSRTRIQEGLAALGRRTNDVATVLGSFGYSVGHEPTYPAIVQQVRAGSLVPYP